ncbi:hypothetical protein Tco_0633611 [Tanacetum coccineum]
MEPTMEEYMIKTRDDYGSGIVRPKIDDKAHFKLKGNIEMKPDIENMTMSEYIDTGILDELLEEFGNEILNVTMDDKEADFNPTKDLEKLERLLAEEPQSNFTKIQVHSVIVNTKPFLYTQLMNPLYGVHKTSKPCKVDKDILSPGSYTGCSSCLKMMDVARSIKQTGTA